MTEVTAIEPYYDAGTATLSTSSRTMTGDGTLWLAYIVPGDQVYGADGRMGGVVETVGANGEITLVHNWRGANQTAGAYTIFRVSDSVRVENFSQRLFNLLLGGNVLSLGDLPITADTLPYGVGNNTFGLTALKAFGRSFLDDEDAAEALGTLGVNVNGQSDAPLRLRNSTNGVEFGHANPAGYGSTLGSEVSSGRPFLLFFGEAGTNWDTYKTRGIKGIGLRGATDGSLEIIGVSNANADNQAPTVLASIDAAGAIYQAGIKIVDGGSGPNGVYLRFANGVQRCIGSFDSGTNAWSNGTYMAERQTAGGIAWPAAFSAPPIVNFGNQDGQLAARGSYVGYWTSNSDTLTNIWLVSPALSPSSAASTIYYQAEGPW